MFAWRMKLARCALAAAWALGAAGAALAQDGPQVFSLEANPTRGPGDPGFDADDPHCPKAQFRWEGRLSLSKSAEAASANCNSPAECRDKYVLIDSKREEFIRVHRAEAVGGATPARGPVILFCLAELLEPPAPGQEEAEAGRYLLQASGLTFDTDVLNRLRHSVSFAPPPTAPNPAAGVVLTLDEADDRESSSLYFAGEVSGASGKDFHGSVDARFKFPFLDSDGTQQIEPFFDLKASSDPEEDPDAMKFGVDWSWILYTPDGEEPAPGASGTARGVRDDHTDPVGAPNWFNRFFQGVTWRNIPKIEAERDFDNSNFMFESRLDFPSDVFPKKRNPVPRLFFTPFIGVEVGRNLNSPVPEAEGAGHARLLFGTTFNLAFKRRGDVPLKRFGLEASYVRRILLKREISFEEADDDMLRAVTFGTNPRDWLEAKLYFKFNKFFDSYVGYEYGEQPPSYKLVDHRVKFGLVYKSKIVRDSP